LPGGAAVRGAATAAVRTFGLKSLGAASRVKRYRKLIREREAKRKYPGIKLSFNADVEEEKDDIFQKIKSDIPLRPH